MPKVVDFVVIFDDGVRKRHFHRTEKGEVKYLSVQLEILEIKVKGKWKVESGKWS